MKKKLLLNVTGLAALGLLVLSLVASFFSATLHDVLLPLGQFALAVYIVLRGVTYEPSEQVYYVLNTATQQYNKTRIKTLVLLESYVLLLIVFGWMLFFYMPKPGAIFIVIGIMLLCLIALARPFVGLKKNWPLAIPISVGCAVGLFFTAGYIAWNFESDDPLTTEGYYVYIPLGIAVLVVAAIVSGNYFLRRAVFYPGYGFPALLLLMLSFATLDKPIMLKFGMLDVNYIQEGSLSADNYNPRISGKAAGLGQNRVIAMLSTLQAADNGELSHESCYPEAQWIISELALDDEQIRIHVEAIVLQCVQKTTDARMLSYALQIVDKLEQTRPDDSMLSYYQTYRKQLNDKL